MARFAFQARDGDGAAQTGQRDAASPAALAQELLAAGLTPVRIAAAEEADGEAGRSSPPRRFGRPVTLDELVIFSHQMTSLMKAGISVVRGIRGLAESTRNARFAEALDAIADNLEAGSDLASSLRLHPRIFSELYASVIHVGENTGRLDESFKRIAGYLEVERETRRRINAATRYPSFVLGAITVAVLILNWFVIPAFADVFAKFNAELPWQTRVIIGVSDFFVAYWYVILAVLSGALFALYRYLQTTAGRLLWDRLKLRLPIVGSLFERIQLARFCQTFAMVSRAGVPIIQGLTVISRALGNEYLALQVNGMREGIERGGGVSQTARESGMFTPVVLQMIAVGEETGAMDDLLEQAAGFYEEEVDYELKSLTDAIEPLLIIAIGIMVLILALGVFLPLWDLSSVANR